MNKAFAWSWSRLKNFRACPKRHYHVDIAKEFKEEESDQLRWGNQVHDAMARRIAKDIALPETMRRYEKFAALLAGMRTVGKVLVENKLAITSDMRPASFFDAGAWYRAVVDVLVVVPNMKAAVAVDWKTGGKVKPDMEQLGLSSQVIFAHYPEVERVETSFEWLGHDLNTPVTYRRDGMAPLWTRMLPEVKVMEDAHRTLTYPARPSGLCINYCPVTSCPYHGKGERH